MNFEQACADTERAAGATVKAAGAVVKAAKALTKAAAEGDIHKIRKAAEGLKIAEQASSQQIRNAEMAWPFSPDDEEALLRDGYESELVAAADSRGLKIRRQDDRLVAFPSLLKVLPEQRAVQIDRTRVTALRPSRLVDMLERNQSKRPRFTPEQFLETLHSGYKLVVGASGVKGTTVASVYRALTLLPGAAREYTKADFARDLFFLDRSRVVTTRSGARVALSSDRGAQFTFVAPDGKEARYYGITFSEVER